MSVSVTIFGTTYTIPGNRDKDWGNNVRACIVALSNGLKACVAKVGTLYLLFNQATSTTLTAGGTLTVTHQTHRVTGSGGAVTIANISDGGQDGQILHIQGESDTNTVKIPATGANAVLNGSVTLRDGERISLEWHNADSVWREQGRSN